MENLTPFSTSIDGSVSEVPTGWNSPSVCGYGLDGLSVVHTLCSVIGNGSS